MFFDDILKYSTSEGVYAEHLNEVFKLLQYHTLVVKIEKVQVLYKNSVVLGTNFLEWSSN